MLVVDRQNAISVRPWSVRTETHASFGRNLLLAGFLRTAEDFRQLIVKAQDGVVVRLGDVADVVLGAENYDVDVRFNGQTAVFMASGCCRPPTHWT